MTIKDLRLKPFNAENIGISICNTSYVDLFCVLHLVDISRPYDAKRNISLDRHVCGALLCCSLGSQYQKLCCNRKSKYMEDYKCIWRVTNFAASQIGFTPIVYHWKCEIYILLGSCFFKQMIFSRCIIS